jgi:rhodanese-related sulfurtransferase
MSLDAFKRLVTADQPEAPDYFVYDAIKNRQERPGLEATLRSSLRGLALDDVLRLQNQGAQIVDVREAVDFEAAYLAGSINIALKGNYATWCGTILSHERPIVVIADPGSEEEAVMRLGRIGFDNVAGYLRDGMAALKNHPELLHAMPRITALALAEQLRQPAPPHVLDVRSAKEWQAGHIAGGQNIPLPHLRERLNEVPAGTSVVVHCEGGYRSAIAASLLSAAGHTNVTDLVGGINAWIASKLPLQQPAAIAAQACVNRHTE